MERLLIPTREPIERTEHRLRTKLAVTQMELSAVVAAFHRGGKIVKKSHRNKFNPTGEELFVPFTERQKERRAEQIHILNIKQRFFAYAIGVITQEQPRGILPVEEYRTLPEVDSQ